MVGELGKRALKPSALLKLEASFILINHSHPKPRWEGKFRRG
jgi:hypothetical protein